MKFHNNSTGIKTNLVLVDGIWCKHIGIAEYQYWIGKYRDFGVCDVYQDLDGKLFGYDSDCAFFDFIEEQFIDLKRMVTDKQYNKSPKRGKHSFSNNKRRAYFGWLDKVRFDPESDDLPF